MHVTLDFETRSALPLKEHGAWRYSEDVSTDILCALVKPRGGEKFVWAPPWVRESLEGRTLPPGISWIDLEDLTALFAEATVIEAHNVDFERAIWTNVAAPRYGWPSYPVEKMMCSMAKCCVNNLPRDLDTACRVLGLPVQKDAEGRRIMLTMCKPKRMPKGTPPGLYWNETPPALLRLIQYCAVDVDAEEGLSLRLPDLQPSEMAVWALDQEINGRGILVDVEACKAIVDGMEAYVEARKEEAVALAGCTPTQIGKALDWLEAKGVVLKDLRKDTVAAVLRKDLPGDVRRFLTIRASVGRSSTGKFLAMVDRASHDGRVRGTLLYHGASTGRWSGRNGVQPQNMPRGGVSDPEACVDAFKAVGFDFVEMIWGDPMKVATGCVRSMIMASPGHDLIACDFSSIEARVLAWLAGEEVTLETYRQGRDLYKVAASSIFGVSYDNVSKDQRQVGKVAVLALGYQGGIGAFASMARNYAIDLETLPAFVFPSADDDVLERARNTAQMYLERTPEAEMSHDAATACDVIKQNWRRGNPNVVRFWKALELACMKAVVNKGKVHAAGQVAFKRSGGELLLRLPSGRLLHYQEPEIKEVINTWQKLQTVVRVRTMDHAKGKWTKMPLYGGLICENVVQAASRDLLAGAMLKLHERPEYRRIIMHVHDEVVVEVPHGVGSVEEVERIMTVLPPWAEGLPIGAEGWRGKRYKK